MRETIGVKWVLALLLACACHDATAQAGEAREMVVAASVQIEMILQDLDFASAPDRERGFGEIHRIVAPRFDHERFSRGVMAKYYRDATPAQRERLAGILGESMPGSIAGTLVGCKIRRIEVMPLGENAVGRAGEASVEVLLHPASGVAYPVTLPVALAEDSGWRAKNIVFNGINIGLTYRKIFAQEMQRAKGAVEQAVQSFAVSGNPPHQPWEGCILGVSAPGEIGDGVVWAAPAPVLIMLMIVVAIAVISVIYGICYTISAWFR